MMNFGLTKEADQEYRKKLVRRGKLIKLIFILTLFLPFLIYLLFHFELINSKSRFSESLQQSVALVITGSGTGTAFLVSPSRLLTAKHVVDSKSEGDIVELIFEKSNPVITTTAKIVWINPTEPPEPEYYLGDIAVLELENPSSLPEGFPYMDIGQSEGIEIRADVILIGYPNGLMSTTSGKISNDNVKGIELFQLDVESWPGNSGGPLILEETEEVIGILVAGFSEDFQGINFANKIDNVISLLEDNNIDILE